MKSLRVQFYTWIGIGITDMDIAGLSYTEKKSGAETAPPLEPSTPGTILVPHSKVELFLSK